MRGTTDRRRKAPLLDLSFLEGGEGSSLHRPLLSSAAGDGDGTDPPSIVNGRIGSVNGVNNNAIGYGNGNGGDNGGDGLLSEATQGGGGRGEGGRDAAKGGSRRKEQANEVAAAAAAVAEAAEAAAQAAKTRARRMKSGLLVLLFFISTAMQVGRCR